MRKLLLGLFVFASLMTTSIQAEPADNGGWNPAFRAVRVNYNGNWYNRPVGWTWGGGWRWAATVEGDYMIGLGQLRLYTAQAWLVRAQAAAAWQEARWLQALVTFRINELVAIQRTKNVLARTARRYDDRLRSLNGIVSGKLNPRTFSAIRFFLMQPNIDPATLAQVNVGVLESAKNFRHANAQGKEGVEIPDFAGGNVIELTDYLQRNQYVVVSGSPAWVALNQLRTLFIEKGEQVLDEVMSRYDAVGEGDYDAWEPISVHSTLVDFEGKDPKKVIPRR